MIYVAYVFLMVFFIIMIVMALHIKGFKKIQIILTAVNNWVFKRLWTKETI